MKLKDKAAIVTGASDGIGKAIAIGYAQEGADVAVGYNRSKDKAEQVAEEIRALGRKAVVFRLEIAEMEDAQKMVDEAVDAFDRVDILVNNAGARLPAAIDECPPDLYRQCVNSNLRGVFAAVKAVTPVMIKNGGGKIINIKIINPTEIFMSLPEKSAKYAYLRNVQAEVLDQWFLQRDRKDNIIKMNTGSGKTTVALLILKSCLNEHGGHAAYVVPDNYLVGQVIREAQELGIHATTSETDINFITGEFFSTDSSIFSQSSKDFLEMRIMLPMRIVLNAPELASL